MLSRVIINKLSCKRVIIKHLGGSQANLSSILERPKLKSKYDNFIGGKFVPPVKGEYFENVSPIDGKGNLYKLSNKNVVIQVFTKAARSTAADIELALDAAHLAAPSW